MAQSVKPLIPDFGSGTNHSHEMGLCTGHGACLRFSFSLCPLPTGVCFQKKKKKSQSLDVAQLFKSCFSWIPPSTDGSIMQHPNWKPMIFLVPTCHSLIITVLTIHSLCGKHGASSWSAEADKVYQSLF